MTELMIFVMLVFVKPVPCNGDKIAPLCKVRGFLKEDRE